MARLAGNLKSKLVLASVGLALAFTPMMAQAKGGHGPRVTFEELDADGNGSITKAEMQAHRNARFASADTNGDGSLSRDELVAHAKAGKEGRMERRVDKMMKRMDADGNGSLSKEEMVDAGGKNKGNRFSRLDKDGNGEISKAEFEEMGKKGKGRKQKN
ncbi:EF-hand domain-containing protein [uncultured Litoreibacter sp.]|uniref:EF-hand domain-containing protein n=1 Tax=uncultured Litoreibacter sp. TaxID=1392394 RepID=UPI00260B8993|nr:EF-hand domain-containing protein [uncultured Litoreibacter sp.]